MARRNRLTDQTPWHHVTNRGARRQVIFHSDHDRRLFGGLIGEAAERFGVRVIAYCLMDNHFHLVLDCPDGGLSEFMHRISSAYARHVNDELGTDGPLFRGRFQSRPILSHGYLLNAVRYVHRNPLDISGATTVESYRWSSHRAYLGLRPSPVWLVTDTVLGCFADVAAFHEFVTGARSPVVLEQVDPFQLLAAIDHVVDEAALDSAVRGTGRNVAVLLLDLLPTESAAVLDTALEFGSTTTRQRARRRARTLAREQPLIPQLAARAVDLATGCAVSEMSRDIFDTAPDVARSYGDVA